MWGLGQGGVRSSRHARRTLPVRPLAHHMPGLWGWSFVDHGQLAYPRPESSLPVGQLSMINNFHRHTSPTSPSGYLMGDTPSPNPVGRTNHTGTTDHAVLPVTGSQWQQNRAARRVPPKTRQWTATGSANVSLGDRHPYCAARSAERADHSHPQQQLDASKNRWIQVGCT